MKIKGRIIPLLLLTVLLLYLIDETEARGGGRGGGGRGGGGRGGSRGGSRGSSWGSSSGGSRGWGGGGSYRTSFGSPKRWSSVGGRRFYYVGYYHGHHYGNSRYGDSNGLGGGLTAAGLLVLLLAFIGLGVGIYYAYMCLRARPLRPKQPTDSEHGPLITPDPDVNGNHEDAPLEASAPVDDDADTKKIPLDEPDTSNNHVKPPASDLNDTNKHPGSPKDKDDILVPIEDEVPPAKLIHEKETLPTLNHVAPIGFVAPAVIIPQDISDHPLPKHSQGRPDAEVHPARNTPAPVYVPVPMVKKPVISDEEDGLLMQECLPHDDSLDPEHCPKLTSPVPQEEVPDAPLKEEPIANNAPIKEAQSQSDPASDTPHIVVPQATPEIIQPKIQGENPPSTAIPESTQPVPASQSPESEITVVAQPEPVDVQKENLTPVEKAVESVPPEVSVGEPSPVLMKEDVEQLQPVEEAQDSIPINGVKPDDSFESTTEEKGSESETELSPVYPDNFTENSSEQPTLIQESPEESNESSDILPQPDDDSVNIPETETASENIPEEAKESPDILPQPDEDSVNIPETETASEKIPEEAVEYPPVVYLETSQPLEKSRSNSKSSVSSEESVPPYTEETSERNPSSFEEAESPDEVVSSMDEDEQLQPVDSIEPALASDPLLETSAHVPAEASSDIPPEPSSEILTEDSSDSVMNSLNSPKEAQSDDPVNISSDIPLESSSNIPLEASNIPLEAYIPDSDDQYDLDPVEEDDTSLPIIKEEGSVDNESENTETDSSEPEVSEYSFSLGPSAPTTTAVLADEVSCTLEPEVTKYAVIPEVEVSHDSDLGESENSEPTISVESGKDEVDSSNPDSSKEEPDSSSNHSVPSVENGLKLKDSAVLEPDAVTTSNDLCSQLPDSTNTLSNQEELNSETSEAAESEGEQAEAEVREEEVKVPTAVHKEPSQCITNASPSTVSSSLPTSSVANDTGSPMIECDPNSQNSHTAQMPNKALQGIPDSTEEDVSSSSHSASSSDLSDDDVPISSPKKSKIPRLVNHNES